LAHYADRIDAGRKLGRLLAARIDGPALVLGVPSGGVQVGAAVAQALHAPLLPLLVRKVGLPEQPQVVVGAIDADGALVRAGGGDPGLMPAELEIIAEDVGIQLRQWKRVFGSPDPASLVRGRTVIIADDALISGLTAHAGVEFLLRRACERIVVAVPVATRDGVARLEALGVEVVAPERRDTAAEIPRTYERLPDVTTDEMVELLARGGPSRPPALPSGEITERELRLVDVRGAGHRAVLRVPVGLGPFPGVIVAGGGTEPGTELGARVAGRLVEAGLASLRISLESGSPVETVLALAADVLSARPEIEPLRLAVAASQEAAPAVVAAAADRRMMALAVVSPPDDHETPAGALLLADAALNDRDLDRLARWLGERLRPG
jgi:putative phosphoribosyl transferase